MKRFIPALLLLLLPCAAAAAPAVKSVTVKVNRAKGDSFSIGGKIKPSGKQGELRVTIHSQDFSVPLTSFQGKSNLTFKSVSALGGIKKAAINSKKKSFSVSGSGVALSGLPEILQFNLTIGG